jgi:DNA-binding MarR family transcriptional regulator
MAERKRSEQNTKAPDAPSARPADLDTLIHERLRLGLVSVLAVREEVSFTELKQLLGATDGNLSVQARRLEDAGYVRCNKGFENRRPKTVYILTREGRAALEKYLVTLEQLLPPRDALELSGETAPQPA